MVGMNASFDLIKLVTILINQLNKVDLNFLGIPI
jgi:hypothetical protein